MEDTSIETKDHSSKYDIVAVSREGYLFDANMSFCLHDTIAEAVEYLCKHDGGDCYIYKGYPALIVTKDRPRYFDQWYDLYCRIIQFDGDFRDTATEDEIAGFNQLKTLMKDISPYIVAGWWNKGDGQCTTWVGNNNIPDCFKKLRLI